jgi:hypothetical protein
MSRALDEAKDRLTTALGRQALGSVDVNQIAQLQLDVTNAQLMLTDAYIRDGIYTMNVLT